MSEPLGPMIGWKVERDRWAEGPVALLFCPVCGEEYSHMGRAYTRMGDPHEGRVIAGTAPWESGTYRRSALVVDIDGECGHFWKLVIQQHKGNNFMWCEVPVPSSRTPR